MNFPDDFLWGAATASYQIEGANLDDGRGECIWYRFSHTPGHVVNGDTGDVACDHYYRYRDDVALMKQLGLQTYRFSVSWPRVLPEGTGKVNKVGLGFYDRLVDTLLEADIKPYLTVKKWDYRRHCKIKAAGKTRRAYSGLPITHGLWPINLGIVSKAGLQSTNPGWWLFWGICSVFMPPASRI